jgi:two-component system OmpR family sensor kinase/two-component system sensor histidine kinase BaeS
MRHSLRTRLTLSFLIAIVVTAGLVVLLANLITANQFTYMVSFTGQRYAQRLTPLFAEYHVQAGGWDGVEVLMARVQEAIGPRFSPHPQGGEMMPRMMSGMGGGADERLLLVDANGRIIADSDPEGKPVSLSPIALDKGAPIRVNGQKVGTLLIVSSLGELNPFQSAFLRQINILMPLAGGVAVLAVLVVSGFQARRIVAPVRALVEAAGRVAGGDLSQRIPVTSQDELGEMAAAFNTMATGLEQQQELRHRAMADIAHELRTPLSVLQIELESIEDGLIAPTPEVIAGLQTSVAHLNRLVEDLRVLSLAEAGELQMEVEPVEMGDLIRDVVNRVQGAARAKGITLDVRLPDMALVVSGDDQRLAQVLLNLLSNALQHTPPDGQITVSAQYIAAGAQYIAAGAQYIAADAQYIAADAQYIAADARYIAADARRVGEDEVHVTVQDTGEGIPAQDLPHVFERFYRADRSRAWATGGTGLGLAIVKQLIQAHGGRIEVESEVGRGTRFTFTVPVEKDRD